MKTEPYNFERLRRILNVQKEFCRQYEAGELPDPNPDYIALVEALVAIENGRPYPLTTEKVIILRRMEKLAESMLGIHFSAEEQCKFLSLITAGEPVFTAAESIDFLEPVTPRERRFAIEVVEIELLNAADLYGWHNC